MITDGDFIGPKRIGNARLETGQPYKVIGVCLPFVNAKTHRGRGVVIDTRPRQLVRLDQACASVVWGKMKLPSIGNDPSPRDVLRMNLNASLHYKVFNVAPIRRGRDVGHGVPDLQMIDDVAALFRSIPGRPP